jgi:2-polyprenyl-3-methyl-5-hydroxy-6-metoxy-1,4-benzoquinol methylase
MTKDLTQIDSCLACGSAELIPVLDLNDQPLANSFLTTPDDAEPEFPLAVNMCQHCHHLQLTHTVNPELIYRNYLYVSGTSQTYLEYMKWYARFAAETHSQHCDPGHLGPFKVLDIGCNDGSQLDAFKELVFRTHGVDPAENLHPVSSAKGHNVVCGFWDERTANALPNKFDIITSQNAFAHIPDPLAYLKQVREKLANDGLMFISTSQADMVINDEFDTIYHEHISFFNVKSMRALAKRAGLHLIDAIKTPIHGTSYIFVLGTKPQNYRVDNIVAMEAVDGLYTDETYAHWAANTLRLVDELKTFVQLYKSKGYTVIGYGAAAKGNTLLNFSKIQLDCIIDDNPLKQGKYSPGMRIPVVGIDYLDTINTGDRVLFVPLAWNFFSEIQRKIRSRRNNNNDKFLKYFPNVEIS